MFVKRQNSLLVIFQQLFPVPLGELDSAALDETKQIYVVCRTGNRSDVACHMLKEKGYVNVKNVIPGMLEWQGNIKN